MPISLANSFPCPETKSQKISLYGHTLSVVCHTQKDKIIEDKLILSENHLDEEKYLSSQLNSSNDNKLYKISNNIRSISRNNSNNSNEKKIRNETLKITNNLNLASNDKIERDINNIEEPHYTLYSLFGKNSWYSGSESNIMYLYDSKKKEWISENTPVLKRAFHSSILRYDSQTNSQEIVIYGGMRTLTSKEKHEASTSSMNNDFKFSSSQNYRSFDSKNSQLRKRLDLNNFVHANQNTSSNLQLNLSAIPNLPTISFNPKNSKDPLNPNSSIGPLSPFSPRKINNSLITSPRNLSISPKSSTNTINSPQILSPLHLSNLPSLSPRSNIQIGSPRRNSTLDLTSSQPPNQSIKFSINSPRLNLNQSFKNTKSELNNKLEKQQYQNLDIEIYGDMWIYNISQKIWYQIEFDSASLYPPPRYGHSATYSKTNDEMYIFGGTINMDSINEDFEDVNLDMGDNKEREYLRKEAHKAMLWKFSFKTNSWTRFTFPFWDITRVSIEHLSRSNFVMINRIDPITNHENIVICLGEGISNDYINVIYTFDTKTQNRWTRHTPSGTIPSAKSGVSYAYIEEDDILIIYGGITQPSQLQSENLVFELQLKKMYWINRTSLYKSLVNTKNCSTQKNKSFKSQNYYKSYENNMKSFTLINNPLRSFASSCLLPRLSRVHPYKFLIHNGIGLERVALSDAFTLNIDFLPSVEKDVLLPNIQTLVTTIRKLYENRRIHYDVTFQFPFPKESIHAHSFILNQSPVISEWIKKGTKKNNITIIDLGMSHLSSEDLSSIVQLMYGISVQSGNWENLAAIAEILKLSIIREYCQTKLENPKSTLQNGQPKFIYSKQLRHLLKNQIPKQKIDDRILKINTFDSYIFYFNIAYLQERCPKMLAHSNKLISKLNRNIVQILQDFIYGIDIHLDSSKKRFIDLLLTLALVARKLLFYEMEEQVLYQLMRHVTYHNARSIIEIVEQNVISYENKTVTKDKIATQEPNQQNHLNHINQMNNQNKVQYDENTTLKTWYSLLECCKLALIVDNAILHRANEFPEQDIISIPNCIKNV